MATKFDEIFESIKDGSEELIKLTVSNFKTEALADTKGFLMSSKDKLERWTRLLIEKQITTEDFEFLVKSQESLAEMNLLLQAGLAKIRIDLFVGSLLNLIIDTVFKAVL